MHRAVVGQGQRRLAQPLGALHQLLDPAQAVEQREFRVDVEVDEVVGHEGKA